jgi:hypothetical protein
MGNNAIGLLFSQPKEKTKEELEKEFKEQQEKFNPFLLGPGKNPSDRPYWIGESLEHYHMRGNKFRLVIDDMGGVEKYYFFFQKMYQKIEGTTFGYPASKIYKLKDVFDASVSSSFHGHIGSKVSAVQQQVSTYLSQIGQLTKTLLPMIREIRMMDERLELYRGSFSKTKENDLARQNEIALKSTWIEVVEQGMQNPNSVYSMATKLGFVTLPDLFFSINPHGENAAEQKKRLHKYLDSMQKQQAFNLKVRNALEKKLVQYYTWKESTWAEMQHTYKFRVKNLKQHYNVIRLYTTWLKPYLTTLKALRMKNDITSADMVNAFETSKMELELLIVVSEDKCSFRGKSLNWNGCLLLRFNLVSRAELTYSQGGQRTPTHSGQLEISIEPYVASDEDIAWYEKHCDRNTLKTVSGEDVDFSQSIEDMLSSLGTDVEKYLGQAEKQDFTPDDGKKEEAPQQMGLLDPILEGFKSFNILVPRKNKGKEKINLKKQMLSVKATKGNASKMAVIQSWIAYDVFKKANRMLSPP